MTIALTVLLVVVMGWFAAGSIWNVRKGRETLRWLQGGLPRIGEKTTLRWLGTTSVEMVLAHAKPPFTGAALVLFLEPRDVPWIWLGSRRRGRRDTLIFRGQLTRVPAFDLEALDLSSWSGREARRAMASDSWIESSATGAEPLAVFAKADGAAAVAEGLVKIAAAAGLRVRRLSVRRREPHLQLHVDLPGPPSPAADVFGALRAIGERATGPS